MRFAFASCPMAHNGQFDTSWAGLSGLTLIDDLGRLLVENTDMQQTDIPFAAEDIFDDAATIRHTGIVQQLLQTFIHGGFRVRIRIVHAIQPTPFLSAYLRPLVLENGIRPAEPDGKRKTRHPKRAAGRSMSFYSLSPYGSDLM